MYGGQINTLAVHPDNDSLLYAGSWGGEGLFKSTDSGATWTAIPESEPSWFRNMAVYDIAIDPHNPSTVWVANNLFIDVSYDEGRTWKTFFFAYDEGRFCYTVAVDPFDTSGDTVYVGTGGPDFTDEYGEIFFTVNGGLTWVKTDFNTVGGAWNSFWQMRFNPVRRGEIWAANRKSHLSPDGLIYMTPDYGEQWWYWSAARWTDETLYYLGYLDEVLVHPENPDMIFASDEYGVLRKPDGASLETGWYWAGFGESCRALCISAAEPDTVYAGLLDRVAKSTDSGNSWDTFLDAPSEFLSMSASTRTAGLIFSGSINRGVFKTADGASTWQDINNGVKANSIFDTDLSAAPAPVLLAGTLAGTYAGSTSRDWQLLTDRISHAVRFHPADNLILFAGFDWDIGKSTDGGASWHYKSVSDEAVSHRVSSIAVDARVDRADLIYAGVAFDSGDKGEILMIHDDGDDFSEARSSTILQTNAPVNTIALHAEQPSVIAAGTGSFYAPVTPGCIFITTDGGSRWHRRLALPRLVVNSIAIAPSSPALMLAGCGGSDTSGAGIYKSTDGGQTWLPKTSGLPKHYAVSDIRFDAQDSSIAYAALYKGFDDSSENLGGTYITLDGGEYWTQIGLSDFRLFDINSTLHESPPPAIHELPPYRSRNSFPRSTIIAGTSSGLYSSSAAGTGIITGSITAQNTSASIDGAHISTQYGASCLSSDGYYLLLLPAGVHTLQAQADGYVQTTIPALTVQAGQSVMYDIHLTAAGSDNSTACLVEHFTSGDSGRSAIDMLRRYRDTVLAATPLGRRLIRTYYEWSHAALAVIMHDRSLSTRCSRLLDRLVSYAAASLAGQRPSGVCGLRDELSTFLYALEQASPDSLKTALRRMRLEMRRTDVDQILWRAPD